MGSAALETLLSIPGVEAGSGLTDSQISALEKRHGIQLPSSLCEYFRRVNGIRVGKRCFFFDLNTALLHVPLLQEAGFPAEWRYVQVLDLENSNPYCVVCAPPIAGRVVCLYHDGAGPQLEFPNVLELVEAVHAQVVSGTDHTEGAAGLPWLLDDPTPSYLEPGPRSSEDLAAGLESLALARRLDPDEDEYARQDAFRFGITLLPPERAHDVAALLEENNEVRLDARRWLERAGSADARRALDSYLADLASFTERCRAALVANRFRVEVRDEGTLRVKRGLLSDRKYLSTEDFYERRAEPDVTREIVERVRSWYRWF